MLQYHLVLYHILNSILFKVYEIYFLEIGLSVVDWIGLTEDRYRWRALVNSVMNLRVA
jgi:hypothetical protein